MAPVGGPSRTVEPFIHCVELDTVVPLAVLSPPKEGKGRSCQVGGGLAGRERPSLFRLRGVAARSALTLAYPPDSSEGVFMRREELLKPHAMSWREISTTPMTPSGTPPPQAQPGSECSLLAFPARAVFGLLGDRDVGA